MWKNMHTLTKVIMLGSWLGTCVDAAPRQPRLSLAEPMPAYFYNNIDGYPGTYAFGYDVLDAATGNSQYRNEERYPNGTVIGSYGYLDPAGRPHRYRYIADERGYRVMRDQPKPVVPVVNPQPSIPSVIIRDQGDIVTWTRRRPNRVTANPEISKNKIMLYHGKYSIFNF